MQCPYFNTNMCKNNKTIPHIWVCKWCRIFTKGCSAFQQTLLVCAEVKFSWTMRSQRQRTTCQTSYQLRSAMFSYHISSDHSSTFVSFSILCIIFQIHAVHLGTSHNTTDSSWRVALPNLLKKLIDCVLSTLTTMRNNKVEAHWSIPESLWSWMKIRMCVGFLSVLYVLCLCSSVPELSVWLSRLFAEHDPEPQRPDGQIRTAMKRNQIMNVKWFLFIMWGMMNARKSYSPFNMSFCYLLTKNTKIYWIKKERKGIIF